MNLTEENMNKLMKKIIKEVDVAIKEGNSPFAAGLINKEGKLVFINHNTSNTDYNPTHHAEMNLINEACNKLHTKDLSDYILISNGWSCSMCMSALIKAKVKKYIYGVKNENDMIPNITIMDIKEKLPFDIEIKSGILEKECEKQRNDARNK